MTQAKKYTDEYRGRREPYDPDCIVRSDALPGRTDRQAGEHHRRVVTLLPLNKNVNDNEVTISGAAWEAIKALAKVNGYPLGTDDSVDYSGGRKLLAAVQEGRFSLRSIEDQRALALVTALLKQHRGLVVSYKLDF